LALPSLALAAGLGKLTVLSSLGQPLKAEIEIVSLQRGEGDALGARLAPSDVFRQAGVDLNPTLLGLKFAVQRKDSGQYVMAVNSPQPVNEPFVDMLVELNWANGRLVREYTFLLDPPEYAGPKSSAAQAASPTPAMPAEQAAPQAAAPQEPPAGVQAAAAEPAPVIAAVPLGPNVPGQAAPSEPKADAAAPNASAAVEPVPLPGQVEVMPVEPKRAEPERAPVEAAAAPSQPAGLVQEPGVKDTYEVVRGDTLSKIAIRNQVQGVSLQQMLVALFRANPDAFVADNMNRLRAGKIINIPDQDAAESVAPADARRIVSAQYADFNDYRRSLGIAVASASAPQGATRQASGEISQPKEEKPAAPKEPPKDELRLSRGDDTKRGAKGAGVAAADDLAAKDNALKEANERIAILQKNVQDLQNLVEMKNKAAAQLQQQAEAAKAAAQKAEAAKAAPAAKVEPVPVPVAPKAPESAKAPEPAKAAPPAKAPEAPKAPEAAKGPEPAKAPAVAKAPEAAPAAKTEPVKAPEAPKAAEAPKAPEAAKAPEAGKAPEAAKAPAPVSVAAAPAKAAPKKAAPAPQPEASFIDDLIGDPMVLGGAGGAVVLLVGYAAYAWRRKRSSQFENSIMSVVPSDADSVLGSVGGRNVDTSSSSIQSDFGQGTSKAAAEEIDPIAEADVYMAYGRDAQAEEILKDALSKDSSRQAIRVKLLEIYANRKDTRSFEAAANELHAATGGRGAEWEKVAALGLSIDPGNTLYGGKPSGTPAPTPSQLPPGFNETAQMPAFNPPTTSAPVAPHTEAPLNIDFDIGTSTSAPSPLPDLDLGVASTPSAQAAAGLDFDLGIGGDKGGAVAAPAALASLSAEPPLSIDFDLPMGDQPAATAAPAAAPTAAPSLELGAIDFDLGTKSVAEPKAEAKAPALDLASINLDLGTPGAAGGNGSGGAPDPRWQEVATKLDLAKAYEEMGDKDGARELLKEVVKEGDTAQQQQAQTMLQALG
jgi:pilus assembly protein FimV